MPYYVLDENNNRQEAYSKEEILSVLAQAIADGTLANIVADAGFITKIKCACTGTTVKEAFVTQAQYNELVATGKDDPNTFYNIIDDTTCEDINEQLTNINTTLNALEEGQSTLLSTYIKKAYYAAPNYQLFEYVYGGTNVYYTYTINNVVDARYYKLVVLYNYEGSSNVYKVEFDLFGADYSTKTIEATSSVSLSATYTQASKTIDIKISKSTATSDIYLSEVFLIKVA